jgi:hypothetical protein
MLKLKEVPEVAKLLATIPIGEPVIHSAQAAQPAGRGPSSTRPAGRVGLDLLAGPQAFRRRLCYVAGAIGREPKLRLRLDAGAIPATLAQGQAEPALAAGSWARRTASAPPGCPCATRMAQGASGPPHDVSVNQRGYMGALRKTLRVP